jgi:acyl-CoA synthetase (AMP-forming)/AMP-acid ligase II
MNRLNTLSDALATHARLSPHKLAVRDSKRQLTYAQWHARTEQLAAGLRALGLQPGDRVALLAYNCLEWMEIYAALARSGLVAVPLNFRLTTAEIEFIAQHSQAQAFIVQDALTAVAEPLKHSLPLRAANWIAFGADLPTGWTPYETLIDQAPRHLPPVQVRPADMAALMYTSGTTGKPKGVIRSHEGSALIALATALEMGFSAHDTALMVMPMCHANSLYFSQTFVHLGATCVIDDRRSFDPEALLATLSEQHVTFTSLVPTHYIMMLGLPDEVKARYDVSAVEKLMISSAPARKETKRAILEFFRNGQLYELYGSTEAGWVTLLRPHEQIDRMGSVGREWAGSGPIRLLDAQGHEVPDGEVGELFSRTAYSFDGYWKSPEKTAEAYRGDWCSVGDMARRDADGFIHLVDRKSNMIISGGENIYPSEVEAVLGQHHQVKDVAVIGVPHDKWGESVHAVVVLHQGQSLSEAELLDWCKGRMAGFKRPQSVRFVSDHDMPRTATGKILHRVLRDQVDSAKV